jgi:hypothetical protein
MRGHGLRVLKRATVGDLRRDPGRPERVIADRRQDAGGECALAHHALGIDLGHGPVGKRSSAVPAAGAEQKGLSVRPDAGGGDGGVRRLGERMMARHHVLLAAFLVQPDQPSRALRLKVFDAQLQRRPDAGEAVGEGGDRSDGRDFPAARSPPTPSAFSFMHSPITLVISYARWRHPSRSKTGR